ncbi:MAG: hypothetical protein PHG44_00495 [Lentisphaeria bacterium]|nr:hypothetical protein [Lentisphaeria bacterium]
MTLPKQSKSENLVTLQKKILAEAGTDLETLQKSLQAAFFWLGEKAQLRDEAETMKKRHHQLSWKGAIKGEYSVASQQWSFFCPVWHTGQAVKAFTLGYQALKDRSLLQYAINGADFIHANSVDGDSDDEKIILAFEDFDDKLNTSAVLECLDGLRCLHECQGRPEDKLLLLQAAQWVRNHAWQAELGLFRDFYEPASKKFFLHPNNRAPQGRPLFDDGIFLQAFRLSGRREFRKVFYDTAERLLGDEHPSGNWMKYPPCHVEKGLIHPRHAYWWGFPMFMAYQDSGDDKYLHCALRACRWYVKAQRQDGGLFRGTYEDFNTESFGHASSGAAAAMNMFLEATHYSGSEEFVTPLGKALAFCQKMQFSSVSDSNLQGSILEKVLPPDGTDRSPYHIRALGSIFYAQAAAKILALGNGERLF